MSVCRDVYFDLVGRSPVDRLLDGRPRVGLLTTLILLILGRALKLNRTDYCQPCLWLQGPLTFS